MTDTAADIYGIATSNLRIAGPALFQLQYEDLSVAPFHLSDSQKVLYSCMLAIRRMNLPCRIVADKARQVYFTTLGLTDGILEGMRHGSAFKHAIVTDELKKTRGLFNMAEGFIKNFPEEARRPHSANHQTLELKFHDTGSLIEAYTGRNSESGRSGTRSYVHFSEAAFYQSAEKLMHSMLQSVPYLPHTTIIYETTANGFDSYFRPKWIDSLDYAESLAREKGARDPIDLLLNLTGWNGFTGEKRNPGWWDGSYFPVFLPWGMMPKYRRDPSIEGLTLEKLTSAERQMMEIHGLDLWQMAWRRFKIREDFGGGRVYNDDHGSCRKFRQEFPLTWQESFISPNKSVFDPVLVTLNISRTEGMARKTFVDKEGKLRQEIQPAVIEWKPGASPQYSRNGQIINRESLAAKAFRRAGADFLIWKTVPKDNEWENRYIIGADISEGLEQRDYSVAAVYDAVLMEFVALFRGHLPPLEFAEKLAQIGRFYNDAWIMGEYNTYGPTVVPALLDLYTNVCPRPEGLKGGGGVESNSYWMRTDERSKVRLVSELDDLMRTKPSAFPFGQLWTEASTFVRHPKGGGKMGAEGKMTNPGVTNFDDTLIAHAEALVGAMYAPPPTRRKRERWAHAPKDRTMTNITSSIDLRPKGVKVM